MNSRLVPLAGLLIALVCGPVTAQALNVGDPVPKLTVARFIKGEKVEKFEPDRTYLIDLYPIEGSRSIRTVAFLTDLRKKFKDKNLVVVGVNLGEKPEKVEAFVEATGEDLDYSVAIVSEDDFSWQDLVTLRVESVNGKAKYVYTPVAIIVKDGVVAWLGENEEIEGRLGKIFAPGFDLARFVDEMKTEQALRQRLEKKLAGVQQKIELLGEAINDKQRLRLINNAITDEPRMEDSLCTLKYEHMKRCDAIGAAAYAQKLLEVATPEALVSFSQSLLVHNPNQPSEEEISANKLGLKAARRANELTQGNDSTCNAALAWAYYANGDRKQAVEFQEKAIRLNKCDDPEVMTNRLNNYQQDRYVLP